MTLKFAEGVACGERRGDRACDCPRYWGNRRMEQ
jgi:hypothetical protein